jgi:HNH endonuclease
VNALEQRIAERIRVEDDCWIWTRGTTREGYALLSVRNRTYVVHRLMYEILIGPIPEGLTLDHMCERPSCVNPFHCELSTMRENILRGNGPPAVNARKTHCKNEHPLSGENLYLHPDGRRECRICRRASFTRANRRRRGFFGKPTNAEVL